MVCARLAKETQGGDEVLKRITKAICNQASKIGWINREIQAYKIEQEKKRIELEQKRIAKQKEEHHHHWERIMRGQAMRDVDTEKDDGRIQAVVVDYVGWGRVGESFNPVFSRTDCVNWAEKSKKVGDGY